MLDKNKWSAEAPSNIALIKYMGKKDVSLNIPDNPSLSYTLPHLVTRVELEKSDSEVDKWEPLEKEGFTKIQLGPKESRRFLQHFSFLKEKFGIKEKFIVRSANNFPQNCGLASSASSFAALTQVSVEAFSEILNQLKPPVVEIASLSRQGSGSSCRSFISPWCMWNEDQISSIDFYHKDLIHMVVIADGEKKKVSSSQAHKNVSTSLLYEKREERARIRLGLLVEAMGSKNWKQAFELCWAEFWDMHVLFETSNPSFGYMTKQTMEILTAAKSIWTRIDDGPLITMDAGPNVHLLFRKEQLAMAKSLKEKYIDSGYQIFSHKV